MRRMNLVVAALCAACVDTEPAGDTDPAPSDALPVFSYDGLSGCDVFADPSRDASGAPAVAAVADVLEASGSGAFALQWSRSPVPGPTAGITAAITHTVDLAAPQEVAFSGHPNGGHLCQTTFPPPSPYGPARRVRVDTTVDLPALGVALTRSAMMYATGTGLDSVSTGGWDAFDPAPVRRAMTWDDGAEQRVIASVVGANPHRFPGGDTAGWSTRFRLDGTAAEPWLRVWAVSPTGKSADDLLAVDAVIEVVAAR